MYNLSLMYEFSYGMDNNKINKNKDYFEFLSSILPIISMWFMNKKKKKECKNKNIL